ncbi:MAG: SMP-30/gluconolactonase/LRE family protein [Pseudomonadota bacterium]
MMELTDIATGLQFPEGPVAMPDGTIILVEIAAGRVTRIAADGAKSVIAEQGGGPNGLAIGPDGRLYVCNNGGMPFVEKNGSTFPGLAGEEARLGWIEVVDLTSGHTEVLYPDCNGQPLLGPNDIVFDAHGGFWFTDHGKTRLTSRDRGGVYYAKADGSSISRVIAPMDGPNGIGLSPAGDRLYVAETPTGRLWAFDIDTPGTIKKMKGPAPWEHGELLANPPGYCLFDSLAVDAAGNICIATIPSGLTVVSPDGSKVERIDLPDLIPTNICFSAQEPNLAYLTLSASGRLVSMPWPRGGAKLNFLT